ncbi:MAG: prepilin-type N-terminal cleavage/methylation domain-containing protein [Patescibacteria group bacterium]
MKRLLSKFPISKPGFSLLEVITVLFIISIGMIGTMSLIVQNIQTEQANRGNLIACQLAQEGLELIRKTRDNNWLVPQDWLTDLSDGTYKMDYSMATPTSITTIDEGVLLLENGFYRHYAPAEGENVNLETDFYRVLTLQSLSEVSEQVQSAVTWSNRGREYNCTLMTILYDWR